jgi:hypothetical protein
MTNSSSSSWLKQSWFSCQSNEQCKKVSKSRSKKSCQQNSARKAEHGIEKKCSKDVSCQTKNPARRTTHEERKMLTRFFFSCDLHFSEFAMEYIAGIKDMLELLHDRQAACTGAHSSETNSS